MACSEPRRCSSFGSITGKFLSREENQRVSTSAFLSDRLIRLCLTKVSDLTHDDYDYFWIPISYENFLGTPNGAFSYACGISIEPASVRISNGSIAPPPDQDTESILFPLEKRFSPR